MSLYYQNPLNSITTTGPVSPTSLDRDYGTNFSVYNIGGYMEVYNLSYLEYNPLNANGSKGNIFNANNTIPISFYNSPNILTSKVFLWNDNISSGRRRLGMLVYVHETQLTYQYTIEDYTTLYNAADAAGVIITGDTKNEVRNKIGTTPNAAGQALMDAWTGSTIEGVSGVTRATATWRIFWGTDWQVTGGTVNYNSTGDLELYSNSGNTVTISGFKSITGGTYNSGTTTLELSNNLGETIEITGFTNGTSGTSGTSGSSGTSGTSGISGS